MFVSNARAFNEHGNQPADLAAAQPLLMAHNVLCTTQVATSCLLPGNKLLYFPSCDLQQATQLLLCNAVWVGDGILDDLAHSSRHWLLSQSSHPIRLIAVCMASPKTNALSFTQESLITDH